ncbi:MAG: sodium/proton antiporter NhaB [Nitrospinae bacterium]|nr:sodium/proton antiporter NhaB [Nitrospinota bacterium]
MNTLKDFKRNFMGGAPDWYKGAIVLFLLANVALRAVSPFWAGWALILEFIFTLVMALKCYPLQPGGLLALEAVILGLATPESVYEETRQNFPVILLLMFMVAAIFFMKEALVHLFTGVIVKVRSKMAVSLIFLGLGAFLSAFLDALTVIAVMIAVATGFFEVYQRYASAAGEGDSDIQSADRHKEDLDNFRGFLRNIMMHGAVGTALGGVTTLVGEPQNLLIGHLMGWNFPEFFIKSAPVTMPTLAIGFLTCAAVEALGVAGYGCRLPDKVREALAGHAAAQSLEIDGREKLKIAVQVIMGAALILALAFHVAEVGLIGLSLIILLTTLNGVTDERQIGKAFQEALPFTALLVVFFAIVAVIHQQDLFGNIIHWTMSLDGRAQLAAFYAAAGILSSISDNVFVATIYINEAKGAFDAGLITREQFDLIAVAVNTGTNIPSVATPNGQAAFLFLLTSAIAGMIRLSYGRMLILALPYTITMTAVGFMAVWSLL